MHENETRLDDLIGAANAAAKALGLRHTPAVYRDAGLAFQAADRTKAGAVVLGEGAFWVVCLADAARLERAGYEFAPRI